LNECKGRNPLVAVITGVYNGEPYLPATLACVQAQTYSNLVHIVLDNASTDATPETIKHWRGGRVPLLTQRNTSLLPQIENWNLAFKMVPDDARYVKLLAADDLMRDDCIERLVAVAEANPDTSCVMATDVFAGRVQPHGLDPATSIFDGHEIAQRLVRRDLHWIPFHHVFFRTAAHGRVLFDRAVNPGFDRDLVIHLLLNGKMGFVDEILFYTRYHAANVTSALVADGALLCERIAELQRCGENIMPEDQVKTQLRAELRIILRHVLLQLIDGRLSLAAKTLERLDSLGMSPSIIDYIASILSWPAYFLNKKLREAAYRAVTKPSAITEEAFLEGSASW
jgi:glycosyltransferase involved in cell wall biosynthesis